MRTARTKFFALLLSVCMLAALLAVPVNAAEFTDVPDWAAKAVDRWTEAGIMEGNKDGTFDPEHKLTRAEFAVILCRIMGYSEKSDAGTFTDLPEDQEAADAILKLNAAGVMRGIGNKLSDPNNTLTREEVAVMVFRALNMKADPKTTTMRFNDADQVSSWAKDAVATMASLKLIGGIGHNTLAPQNDIPKQDMAALLDKMIAAYVTENGAKVDTSEATNPNGVVIIKASNVTVESAADAASIIITEDAPKNANVTVTGEVNEVIVSAEGAKLTVDKDAEVGTVTVEAAKADVTVSGTVADVAVTEDAEGAKITVAKDAEVSSVTVEAPKATVAVSGTVADVTVAEGADNTKVSTTSGAKIENVTTSAENVSVSGAANTVGTVTADSGSANVSVKGAEVSNEGADKVTAGNTTVAEGESQTVNTTPSTGGGGGSSTPTPTTYSVTVAKSFTANEGNNNVTVAASTASAAAGATVTVTVTPDEGYTLTDAIVRVWDTAENAETSLDIAVTPSDAVTITSGESKTFTFTMPAQNVKVIVNGTVTAEVAASAPAVTDAPLHDNAEENAIPDGKLGTVTVSVPAAVAGKDNEFNVTIKYENIMKHQNAAGSSDANIQHWVGFGIEAKKNESDEYVADGYDFYDGSTKIAAATGRTFEKGSKTYNSIYFDDTDLQAGPKTIIVKEKGAAADAEPVYTLHVTFDSDSTFWKPGKIEIDQSFKDVAGLGAIAAAAFEVEEDGVDVADDGTVTVTAVLPETAKLVANSNTNEGAEGRYAYYGLSITVTDAEKNFLNLDNEGGIEDHDNIAGFAFDFSEDGTQFIMAAKVAGTDGEVTQGSVTHEYQIIDDAERVQYEFSVVINFTPAPAGD